MNSRAKVVLSLSIILILLSIAGIALDVANYIQLNEPVEDVKTEQIKYQGDMGANLEISGSSYYKGHSIPALLSIEIRNLTVYVDTITISVHSNETDRIASQDLLINETLVPGDYERTLAISPAFDVNGFVALNYGAFSFLNYSIQYKQNQEFKTYAQPINQDFSIIAPEIYDQAPSLEWKLVDNSSNVDLQFNGGNISLSSSSDTFVSLKATMDTNGYTGIHQQVIGIKNSEILFQVDSLIVSNDTELIPIGSFTSSNSNFTINATLRSSETLDIHLYIPTRENVMFVASANNNFNGRGSDGLFFQYPEYYIDQVSKRYKRTFNISFMELVLFDFKSTLSRNLYELIEEARDTAADALDLQGPSWQVHTGYTSANAGLDVMLVFTNKTMDHLGIVIGNYGEPYNVAVNARGSGYSGDYRLPSSFADNLIQHEMSHIFGAPDRWTHEDEASVMTKSLPEDAFLDIAFGNYWLMRTNWMEEDIQTMFVESIKFIER